MVSALRRWWGGRRSRIDELQERVAAGPETFVVPVKYEFSLRQNIAATEAEPQKITLDHDFKEMARAVFIHSHDLRSGKARTITTGPTCEVCGQEGLAYLNNGQVTLLVCRHVEKGIAAKFTEMMVRTMRDCEAEEAPALGSLVFRGCPIESIECGRNLKMHLRMRHCWFD